MTFTGGGAGDGGVRADREFGAQPVHPDRAAQLPLPARNCRGQRCPTQVGRDRAGPVAATPPSRSTSRPPPGFQLLFDGLHAEQELGRPFLFHLELSSGKLQTDVVPKLIGSALPHLACTRRTRPRRPNRYFHGIVTRVVSAGLSGGAYRYKLEVRPWIWLLSQVTDCRIFQNKSAFQIVTQMFRDAGFSDFEDQAPGRRRRHRARILRAVPRDVAGLRDAADGAVRLLLLLHEHARPRTRWCSPTTRTRTRC